MGPEHGPQGTRSGISAQNTGPWFCITFDGLDFIYSPRTYAVPGTACRQVHLHPDLISVRDWPSCSSVTKDSRVPSPQEMRLCSEVGGRKSARVQGKRSLGVTWSCTGTLPRIQTPKGEQACAVPTEPSPGLQPAGQRFHMAGHLKTQRMCHTVTRESGCL